VVQRLAGASLLVFANKTDVEGCMTEEEILSVCSRHAMPCEYDQPSSPQQYLGATAGIDTDTSMAHPAMQRYDWNQP
jgi:hypothetical protein